MPADRAPSPDDAATRYDDLGQREQAVVRARWARAITTRLRNLDLASEFRAAGRSWTEADDQGRVVRRSR